MSMIGSPHGEARGLSPCRRAPVAEPAGRTRFRALLVVLACAAVLGACAEHGGRLGFELVNDLGVPVEIVYLGDPEVVAGRLGTEDGDDREVFDFGLTPDPSDPSAARCTTADIVAKSLDGRVLARIPAPVCDMNTLLLSSFPGS